MSSNNHNRWCVIVFRPSLGPMVEEQQKVCLHQICLTESIELKLWRFSLQVNFVKPATKGKKGGAKERADWLRTVLSLTICFVTYHDLMLVSHCSKIIYQVTPKSRSKAMASSVVATANAFYEEEVKSFNHNLWNIYLFLLGRWVRTIDKTICSGEGCVSSCWPT